MGIWVDRKLGSSSTPSTPYTLPSGRISGTV